MRKYYKATGLVYGNLWGGGEGAYPARKYSDHTKKGLLNILRDAVKNGSADSGMGYQKLIGGLFSIETITTIIFEGKEYQRKDYEEIFIGKMKRGQRNFLEHLMDNME